MDEGRGIRAHRTGTETPVCMTPAWLHSLEKIRAGVCQNEAALHDAVAARLSFARVEFRREVWLNSRDRIDFTVEEKETALLYGIECKTEAGGLAVWRQLERYAAAVDFLVLVTTKALRQVIAPDPLTHRCKGLYVLELWKNF